MGKGKKLDKEKDFDNQFQERNSNLPYFLPIFSSWCFLWGKNLFFSKRSANFVGKIDKNK